MIDEKRTKTLDRTSLLSSPCNENAPSIASSPPAEPSAPSQRNSITVEQFLQAQSRARKPARHRNYKRRPKASIKSDLERLKEADSSFAREDDQLFSDSDDDTLALPAERCRKAESAGNPQTASKKRRTTKTKEETGVLKLLELQEEQLPNIATRSLHEQWHPVDPRKGRPFIQPTFVCGRRRISLGPLKPAPVPPLVWIDDGLSGSFAIPRDSLLTTKVPRKKARPPTRMSLSMEPTEEHERKLKLWKRSVRRLRRALLISLLATTVKNSR